MKEIRFLTAQDIECRVQQVAKDFTWCSLLLYKNARVDMQILDETFGVFGWQRSHELIDGKLFCTIKIWDEAQQQWVSKQDVGTESNTEKEKGQASDAFKRAGFNIGIGRELYTAPSIFIGLSQDDVRNNKVVTRFSVDEINYNGRVISYLRISDNKGNVRYEFADKKRILKNIKSATQVSELGQIFNLHKELHRDNDFMNALGEQKQKLNG